MTDDSPNDSLSDLRQQAKSELDSRDQTAIRIKDLSLEELRQLANELQVAQIQLERQSKELAEREENLRLLYELGESLAQEIEPPVVAQKALELVTSTLSILRGEIMTVDEESGQLQVLALIGYDEDELKQFQEKAEMRLQHGLAWQVAQTKEGIALDDVNCSEHWLPIPGLDDRICSAAAVPLQADDTLLGVMALLSDQEGHLDEGKLPFLTSIAATVALALQNAFLFEAEHMGRQSAETLREAHLQLTKTLDIETINAVSLDYLSDLVGYDHAAVVLREGDEQLVINAYRSYQTEIEPRPLSDGTVPLARYPQLQQVIETQDSVLLADTQETPTWQPLVVGEASRSWLAIPLIATKSVLGFFVAGKVEPHAFNRKQSRLAEALAVQTATAIQNGQLFRQVQIGQSRLKELADQLVTTLEDERRRISRELHDEAGQALNALKVNLGLIRDQLPEDFTALREQLQNAGDLTAQTVERLRFISYDLRPPELDTLGLDAALEDHCEQISRRTGLTINYRGHSIPSLSDTAQLSFYRFLQEALTNVVKHANASEVKVALTYDNRNICLTVADNGRGFQISTSVDRRNESLGLGLLGVKERFESQNGFLQIESPAGEGATLIACIPGEEASDD